MEEMIKHGFTGIWIPAEVIEDYDLTIQEKFLFGYIHSLSMVKNEKGERVGCFASNEHLSKRLGMSLPSVIKGLSNLRKNKLIKTVSFDGRKRVMRTIIKIGG